MIERLLGKYPLAQTRGFRKHVYAALRRDTPIDEAREIIATMRMIPDAYIVDPVRGTVIIFEVEDRHPVTAEKFMEYALLGDDLAYAGWKAFLVLVSRWGAEAAVDLPAAWVRAVETGKLGARRAAATPPPPPMLPAREPGGINEWDEVFVTAPALGRPSGA